MLFFNTGSRRLAVCRSLSLSGVANQEVFVGNQYQSSAFDASDFQKKNGGWETAVGSRVSQPRGVSWHQRLLSRCGVVAHHFPPYENRCDSYLSAPFGNPLKIALFNDRKQRFHRHSPFPSPPFSDTLSPTLFFPMKRGKIGDGERRNHLHHRRERRGEGRAGSPIEKKPSEWGQKWAMKPTISASIEPHRQERATTGRIPLAQYKKKS